MQCPRCHHKNEADARFCEECAAPLTRTCSNCGRQLSPTAKFCPQCAHPAGGSTAQSLHPSPESYTPKHLAERILTSKAAMEGERKQVTVLFADLKGSMELLADRDPEEARKILDPVLERMMEAVHRYEGTVNQVMGDGIMALFGAPLAHEDHAVRACYAALQMQESVRRYADDVRRSQGIEVQIRVGLNTGVVVVRSIGSDLHMDYTAVGQTTHLAARMEQLATPGSIRMTGNTLRLAEGYIEVNSLGEIPVKGLSETVDVYEVVGPGAVRSRLQAATARGLTRFVGRDVEVEQLRKALEHSQAGHGQLLASVGEPGVGKSRLFHEFTHSHRVHEWLVLQAGSVPYGKATSYLPVIDLLKAYFKVHDREAHREIREKVTGKILTLDRALEPTLPALLALLDVPVEDAHWQTLDPPQRRHRTLDGVKRLLLRESQRQPVLLVFEDLHWIDSETQAFLEGLVESLPTARLLLLVNYRPEYRHAWGSKTYYTQLRLDTLPRESASELLLAMLGADPLVEALKPILIARTSGNPLFLEESVRMLVETGTLTGERGDYRLARPLDTIDVPTSVQAILASRLDRLTTQDKQLLQTASVIGKDVPITLLRAIAELAEDALHRALTRLQAAEFLYETNLFPEQEYTFKHALTHEVAYASLLHDRRRALHARIVDAIEHLWAHRTAEHAASLAHHALRAERWQQAVAYSRQAAARAQAQSAYREVVGCLEQALAALPHLPHGTAAVEDAIDVRLELRNALFGLGDHARIIRHLREAADLAGTIGDQRREARAAAIVALSLWASGEHELATESARKAETIAFTLGDTSLRLLADFYLGVALYAVGDYAGSASHLARIVTMLAGERWRERFGLMGPPAIFCASFLAWSHAEQGKFDDAYALGHEALDRANILAEPYSQLHARTGLSLPYLRRGDVAKARPLIEGAIELCERWTLPLWFPTAAADLGYVYTLSGRGADGLALLERAVAEATALGMRGNQPMRLTYLGEALLSLGRVDEARARAEEALAMARELREHGNVGWALRLLGEIDALSAAAPAVRAAEARYREGLAIADPRGMRPLAAHCHLGLGKLYRRTGERQEAQEHLTTATTMYREMDMRFWLEKAEAELTGEGA